MRSLKAFRVTPGPARRTWRRGAVLAAVVAAAFPAVAAADPASQADIDTAIQRGAAWVVNQQGRTTTGATGGATNGSLPGFQGNWVMTSLAAAGVNAADVQNTALGVTQSLQDYQYSTYPGNYATLPNTANVAGAFGREALISSSAGIQVTKITPDLNFTASLASKWRKANGDFGAFAPNSDGFALLATNSLYLPKGVRQKIVANLLSAQKTGTTPDSQGRTATGGWSFTAGTSGNGDIDMTGAVLSMLCQEGMTPADTAIAKGIDFLHRRLNTTTGGFGTATENSIPPNNLPSAGWALIGLKACGVDPQSAEWTTPNDQNPVKFILGLQRLAAPTDPGTVGYGSFKYVPTTAYPAGTTDMNSTEVAVRALSNFRWSAPAPVRANPANPRLRPAPTVADGTTVPIALSVDSGDTDVRFCAVRVPSGASLTDVLTTAKTASIPAGCVDDFTTSKGVVTSINGKTLPSGSRWQVHFQGGAGQLAGTQPVRFGDVVALDASVPVTGPAAPVAFAEQPQSTISAARTLTFTAKQDGVDVTRASVTGTQVSDFLVTRDGCADATLNTNDTCTIDLRFAPGETGARTAAVRLLGTGSQPVTADVQLTGTGGALPKGDKGDTGDTGASGTPGAPGSPGAPGADGATGAAGPTGATGPAGATGATGATGPTGAAGSPGATGATGAKGDAGSNGAKGDAGTNGTNGAAGANGAKGDKGDKGDAGEKGDAGAKGDKGEKGDSISCRVVTKGSSRITCTVSGDRAVRARLTRHGRTYATGTVRRTRTELRRVTGRRIVAGVYTLRFGSGKRASALKVVIAR
jgi:hypothetical protein